MILIVRLISKYALWIYILCGLGMLFYLRSALNARREGAQAIFSLERETSAGRMYRSSGMIVLLLMIAIGVYTLSNYVELPAIGASPLASPTPTPQSATPTTIPRPSEALTPTLTPEPTATRRPRQSTITLPTAVQDGPAPTAAPAAPAQCPHTNVQVVQPGQGQVIDSGVQVAGTALKEQFDRYEFKFKSQDIADEWHWVETFRTPVQNGPLGFWTTSHLPPGSYRFLLIVIDKTGNSQECSVPVVIQHSQ
jgi:hypothetical protein